MRVQKRRTGVPKKLTCTAEKKSLSQVFTLLVLNAGRVIDILDVNSFLFFFFLVFLLRQGRYSSNAESELVCLPAKIQRATLFHFALFTVALVDGVRQSCFVVDVLVCNELVAKRSSYFFFFSESL